MLDSYPDLQALLQQRFDDYLIEALNLVVNVLNVSFNDLKKMSEKDFNTFITDDKYKSNKKNVLDVHVPDLRQEYPESNNKASVIILPLSIEDESLTAGTASVMREFASDINISLGKSQDYLTYNRHVKKFDIRAARERHKFYKEMECHTQNMERFREIMEMEDSDDLHNDVELDHGADCPTSFKTQMKQLANHTKEVMTKLKEGTNRLTNMKDRVLFLKTKSGLWIDVLDDFGRSPLHHAVIEGCTSLVESLLLAGACVNIPEGCGVTPVMIAINHNNLEVVKILIKYGARITGSFHGNIPDPLQMAYAIGNKYITQVLEDRRMYEIHARQAVHKELGLREESLPVQPNDTRLNHEPDEHMSERGDVRLTFNLTIGDAKSTSTLRGVRNRAPDEFGSFKDVPGDFHTQGYVMECLSRISGPGGFYYVIRQILRRHKVTPKSFVDIFKEGNYERNMDALNNYFWGLCIAAVASFKSSDFFPDDEALKNAKSTDDNVNNFLLKSFKAYLQEASKTDVIVAYHSKFITSFGPLLLAFHESVRYGNAKTREACWLSSLVMFCALKKKNYKDEAISHIANFTALWPTAIREMYRRNSSISYKGRKGHNLALDEFVETVMVRPLKMFSKHHSTLSMMKKVNMNIELLTHIKQVFKEEFEVHNRVKSVVPDAIPDCLKIAWFAVQQEWFVSQDRNVIPVLDHNKKDLSTSGTKAVPSECTDVESRGKSFINKNIKEILCRLFPHEDMINRDSANDK